MAPRNEADPISWQADRASTSTSSLPGKKQVNATTTGNGADTPYDEPPVDELEARKLFMAAAKQAAAILPRTAPRSRWIEVIATTISAWGKLATVGGLSGVFATANAVTAEGVVLGVLGGWGRR